MGWALKFFWTRSPMIDIHVECISASIVFTITIKETLKSSSMLQVTSRCGMCWSMPVTLTPSSRGRQQPSSAALSAQSWPRAVGTLPDGSSATPPLTLVSAEMWTNEASDGQFCWYTAYHNKQKFVWYNVKLDKWFPTHYSWSFHYCMSQLWHVA